MRSAVSLSDAAAVTAVVSAGTGSAPRCTSTNARANPLVSVCVQSDDWSGEFVQIDGHVEVLDMPDALEANMQKATDLGVLGVIIPTVDDALEARDADGAHTWMARHIRDFRKGYELAGIDFTLRLTP